MIEFIDEGIENLLHGSSITILVAVLVGLRFFGEFLISVSKILTPKNDNDFIAKTGKVILAIVGFFGKLMNVVGAGNSHNGFNLKKKEGGKKNKDNKDGKSDK